MLGLRLDAAWVKRSAGDGVARVARPQVYVLMLAGPNGLIFATINLRGAFVVRGLVADPIVAAEWS